MRIVRWQYSHAMERAREATSSATASISKDKSSILPICQSLADVSIFPIGTYQRPLQYPVRMILLSFRSLNQVTTLRGMLHVRLLKRSL